jgi:hypothetical protein
MWILIQKKWPIAYFDATGNVCKRIENQKIPYFYSLSIYDKEAKSILSIGDFITTCHTTTNVSLFLFQIKFILQKYYAMSKGIYKPSFESPPIIVIDQSWVLLNSILSVFNNLNITEFLKISFDCLINEDLSRFGEINTLPYHDSVHLMRNFIKNSKKIQHFTKESETAARKYSVFCFCLLQTCSTIADFVEVFLNVYNIFNQINKNEKFINSMIFIEHTIENRNINPKIRLEESLKDKEHFKIREEIEKERPFTKTQLKNVKKSSPFRKYFDKLLKKKCRRFDFDNKVARNDFFNPGLFNLINSHVSILPLWTGCLLNVLKQKSKTFKFEELVRLHSNPGEKNFDILKNKIVLKSGAMPSEVAALMYERFKYKFDRDYSTRMNEISPLFTKITKTKESDFVRDVFKNFYSNENTEIWKKDNKKRKNPPVYYGSKSNMAYLDLATIGGVNRNRDFINIFSGKHF